MKPKIEFTFMRILVICLLLLVQYLFATEARIVEASGDVKIRRGIEENWQPGKVNLLLDEIDTIWTGEDGFAVLEMDDGRKFQLRPSSLLDIVDLRKIDQQELFLNLMKIKVGKLEQSGEKTPLRLGTVSVVHGASQDTSDSPVKSQSVDWETTTLNGIRDLFSQAYYPNVVLKIEKFKELYPAVTECGELHYYLGYSFEKLGQSGQATDAYHKTLEEVEKTCPDSKWSKLANDGLERLKQTNQKNN
ncbi:MAG: hypothetical protein JSW33_12705 [bacterium]|nr:MAG: hypothetical protein JSW33_12705 [bacterium]